MVGEEQQNNIGRIKYRVSTLLQLSEADLTKIIQQDYTLHDFMRFIDFSMANYIHQECLLNDFVDLMDRINKDQVDSNIYLAVQFLRLDVFNNSMSSLIVNLDDLFYELLIKGYSHEILTTWKIKIIYYRIIKCIQQNNITIALNYLKDLQREVYLINDISLILHIWWLLASCKLILDDLIAAEAIMDDYEFIVENADNEYLKSKLYVIKAAIHSKYGELSQSRQFNEKAIKLYKNNNLLLPEIMTMRNLCLTYYNIGQYNLAINNLQELLAIDMDFENNRFMCLDLFILYFLYGEIRDYENQEQMMMKLKHLAERDETLSSEIYPMSEIVEVLTLKKSNSAYNMGLAIKRFSDLYERTDISHICSDFILLHYGELLLEEWKLFNREESLDRLIDLISDLITNGKNSNILIKRINGFILKSKLLLYLGDLDEALYFIQKAETKSNEHNIVRLSQLAERERMQIKQYLLNLEVRHKKSQRILSKFNGINYIQEKDSVKTYLASRQVLEGSKQRQLQEIKDFYLIMQPTRFSILYLLSKYSSLISSDLRKFLDISWGNYSTHLTTLINNDLVEYTSELIDDKFCKVISISHKGSKFVQNFNDYVINLSGNL